MSFCEIQTRRGNLPVLWCRERIETLLQHLLVRPLNDLPVLWCRERIETDMGIDFGVAGPYLPVLWCRERIETLPILAITTHRKEISLYSGAGSGLKPMKNFSFFMISSDLPVLWCRERIETPPYAECIARGAMNLPVLWCRERIETQGTLEIVVSNPNLPVLWCRERIETVRVRYSQPWRSISLYSGAGSGLKLRTEWDNLIAAVGSPCTLVQGAD